MEIIGKEYYYETKGDTIKHSVLKRQTPAWNIFENGDWVERYAPLYETVEELENVGKIVKAMYMSAHVPNVVHFPGIIS